MYPVHLFQQAVTCMGFAIKDRYFVKRCESTNFLELGRVPIPPGSVNEYQFRLGRQRQVWFIPFERGVCR